MALAPGSKTNLYFSTKGLQRIMLSSHKTLRKSHWFNISISIYLSNLNINI